MHQDAFEEIKTKLLIHLVSYLVDNREGFQFFPDTSKTEGNHIVSN